jgi:hypothetical protein
VVAINPTNTESKIPFRWTYIALPAAFLLLSLVLTAIFYSKLTAEIAYHFQGDTPDRWLGRSAFIAWMIIPQFFFTLLAFATVRVIMLGARYWPPDSTPLKNLLPVMGNMLALPQIILFFAMLQFFLYNAYQMKMVPLWIIALIVMVLGGITLVVFFVRTIRRFRRRSKSLQE